MKKLLLTLAILFLLSFKLSAQLLAGGEIYYEITGKLQYKITVHLYRECDASPLNNVSAYVISDTMRQAFTLNRVAIKKINDTCGNPCNKSNDYSNPGFEKHSFVGYVDFNNVNYKKFITAGYCNINFAVRQGGRDNRTTTHGSGMYYLDAGINVCDTNINKNHSPTFSMDPKFLVACNQNIRYSPGPLDSMDYDSLAFSLEPVQIDYNTSISYNTNYNYLIPLTPYCPPNPGVTNCKPLPNAKPPRGFYFDVLYCAFAYTPTICDEIGYVKIKVKEFRKVQKKMVYLGFVTREMMVSSRVINNNNITNIIAPLSSNTSYICSENLKLNIKTEDHQALPNQLTIDTTFIEWDHGYSKSTLTINDTLREKTAVLELRPDPSNTGKCQYYTIYAYDKMCNISLHPLTNIVINQSPPKVNKSYTLDSCNIFTPKITSIDTSKSVSFDIQIYDSLNKYVSTFYNQYTFNTIGKFILKYKVVTNGYTCASILYDTITIKNALAMPDLNITKDTAVCERYPANLIFHPSKIKGIQSINWYRNDTLVSSLDSTYSFVVNKAQSINLKVSDTRNCLAQKKINFNIYKPNSNLLFSSYAGVCPGDTMSLKTNASASLKKPINYQWILNGKTVNQNSDSLLFQLKDTSKVKVVANDDNHCIALDSGIVYPSEIIQFDMYSPYIRRCQDSTVLVTLNSISKMPDLVQWMQVGVDTFFNKSFSNIFYIKNDTKVKVIVYNSNLCNSKDSIEIKVIPNPIILEIRGKNNYCDGDSTLQKVIVNTKSNKTTFNWKYNGLPVFNADSIYNIKQSQSGGLEIKVGFEDQCYTSSNKSIKVFPKPMQLEIKTDTFYNPLNQIELSTNTIYSTYQWFNNVSSRTNIFWASELGAAGKYSVWCHVNDINGCASSDTLDIFTDRRLAIGSTLSNVIKIYPNPVSNILHIEINKSCKLELYSMEGKLLLELPLVDGLNSVSIENLPSGIYLLKVGEKTIHFSKV